MAFPIFGKADGNVGGVGMLDEVCVFLIPFQNRLEDEERPEGKTVEITTSVLYEQRGRKIFQIAFLVGMPCDCLKSESEMVSMGLIDNGRPVLEGLMFSLSCLKKKVTFVTISL